MTDEISELAEHCSQEIAKTFRIPDHLIAEPERPSYAAAELAWARCAEQIAESARRAFEVLERQLAVALPKMTEVWRAANAAVFASLGVKPTRKRRKIKKYWKRFHEGRF
jgi:hypothetical protein